MAGEMNGLTTRAKNWNFMDLLGARQTVASGASPLWKWPAGGQKGARAKGFGAQAYWFASGIRAEI